MYDYLKASISAGAIRHNLAALRSRLADRVKLCAVVKANAYGHGLELLLPTICKSVDMLAVATPAEGLELRQLGYEGDILVFFSACGRGDQKVNAKLLAALLESGVTLTVTSCRDIEVLSSAAARVGCNVNAHLKVDTGMSRSGCLPDAAAGLVAKIHGEPLLALTGIYTHLASADEADKSSAQEQLACFHRVLEATNTADDPTICKHAANSAGLTDLPESHFDMVRAGISMYGYHPSSQMRHPLDLKPALRLTGHVMQIRDVPTGRRVGYGLTHEFNRPSRVGLIPIGYADGYNRLLSNRGVMRFGLNEAPVCGRVSMDQTTVDLTDQPEVQVGDEVEIISNDPAVPNSVERLADLLETISYEITCRLGNRIERTLVD